MARLFLQPAGNKRAMEWPPPAAAGIIPGGMMYSVFTINNLLTIGFGMRYTARVMRTNPTTTLHSGKTKKEAKKVMMKIIAFILVLFCCVSCTQTYKNYDDFLVELKKETKNKTSIELLYVGSAQNQDYFLLNNKKVIVENGGCLSKVATFVRESEKYDFISWNTERRLRLKAAFIYKDGNAEISYASLDNKNVFVIERDIPNKRNDGDSSVP